MRHQPFETQSRTSDGLLINIAKRQPCNDGFTNDWWRWIERPADAYGVGRISGSAAGEIQHAANEDEGANARGLRQDAVLSPRCHAHVHCCCLAAAGGGNMW